MAQRQPYSALSPARRRGCSFPLQLALLPFSSFSAILPFCHCAQSAKLRRSQALLFPSLCFLGSDDLSTSSSSSPHPPFFLLSLSPFRHIASRLGFRHFHILRPLGSLDVFCHRHLFRSTNRRPTVFCESNGEEKPTDRYPCSARLCKAIRLSIRTAWLSIAIIFV